MDSHTIISVKIPSRIFLDRKLSVLEAIVFYMRDECCLSFKHIARLLNRDQRTIWTAWDRARKKNEK